MVDIIPNSQHISPDRPALLPIAFGVFLVMGVLFFGVGALVLRSSSQLDMKEEKMRNISQEQSLQERTELSLLVDRVHQFVTVAKERKNPLGAFLFMEEIAHPDVVFIDMRVSMADQTLIVSGKAPNFQTVHEQELLIREAGATSRVRTIRLDDSKNALFEFEIVLTQDRL
ncbi:MAG: hypothetical protein Q8P70_02635 [bacterium]|nr:hypothetical protein [bacterium]